MKRDLSDEVGWGFLATWVIVGSISLLLGLTTGFPALWWTGVLGSVIGEMAALVAGSLMFALFLGSGLALGQAIALRPTPVPGRNWVIVSGLAAMLILGPGLAVFLQFFWDLPDVIAGIIVGFLLGFSTSLGQWWLLRKVVEGAWWWLVLGTVVPTVVIGLFLPFAAEGRELVALIGVPLATAVLTGLAMMAVLRGVL